MAQYYYTASPLPPLTSLVAKLSSVPENERQGDIQAYTRCLDLEQAAKSNHDLVAARFLGQILLEIPNTSRSDPHAGRPHFAAAINACGDNDMMVTLGWFYIQLLVCLLRPSGPTPAPTAHPSLPPFDEFAAFCTYILEHGTSTHERAKYAALKRDRGRCTIGRHIFDSKTCASSPTLLTEFLNTPNRLAAATQCAHIISESFHEVGDDPMHPSLKRQWSGVWAILYIFGGIDVAIFNGRGVHHLTNVLTMDPSTHSEFDHFELWFEAIAGQADTYRIVTINEVTGGGRLPADRVVTFQTQDPQLLPVPDPDLLAFHAACCRIARLSGTAEYIEQLYNNRDQMHVLAEDGSSNTLLDGLLLLSIAAIGA